MMPSGLLDSRRRPAGAECEPRRPKDPKWCGRRGELRSDYGPIYPLVNIKYSDGAAAVSRQEDGSGFASYQSGKKAVCVLAHNQTRRVSAIVYASSEFNVQSAVPENARPGDRRKLSEEEAARQQRKARTRHLGAMDEWGIGLFESVPDGTGARGSYEVSATHVTVSTPGPNGEKKRVPRSSLNGKTQLPEPLSLRLCAELVVSFDPARGTTAIDFNSAGVSYTFHVGEVWKWNERRAGNTSQMSGMNVTTPAAIFDNIHLQNQMPLDSSCNLMMEGTTYLDKTLKCSTSCLSSGALQVGSPQGTMQKSASESTMRLGLADFRKGTEGRMDFKHEHLLKKKLSAEVHPVLAKTKIEKTMKEGYLWPQQHPGKPAGEPPQVAQPISLQTISCHDVGERAASLEAGKVLAVLVVASWAKKSKYSSSAHAQIVAEATYSELKAMGEDRVQFCLAELSEAGAIHSSTKFSNPLVKQYGVKEAPWLLIFSRGELVLSENPSGPSTGGIGFASRLRYMAFAKPRVLIFEPAPSPQAAQAAAQNCAYESEGRLKSQCRAVNNFELQMETEEVLRRSGFDFDLALNAGDAMRLSASAQPAYGMFLCSSEAGVGAFSEVASRIKERNPKAVAFICHDLKSLGPLDESFKTLVAQSSGTQKGLMAGILRRPLTKSSLESALAGNDDVRIHYPTCGIVKENLVELIQRKLGNV